MREFLWDLDGTLLDTYPAMVKAFQRAVTELGGTITAEATYQLMRQQSVGYAERTVANQYGWDWHELRAGYQRFEPQLQQHPTAFDGAQAVLERVVAVGGHNYLMTHRNEQAQVYLQEAGLAQYFTDAVTAAQPFPRKPDPAALNYLLDKHQVDRHQAVMVGDRNLDIDAGHNAGIAGYLFDIDRLIHVTSAPEVQVTDLNELLPLVR
ncbi:phosphohydrolase [Lactiplantibacillus pentosus]|uniref:Hydrolase, HAD superfamily n=2 Tax=Lactiplantibacillus pentosus TaxID=1589 RepID=G0M086_LACPE|nr:HAD family hydrolase [Lactiplantibacillus pentosus]CCC18218.1 hydrolase, HAD superfamily [Lactiplantibacillus pentosus IG1]MCT3282907.1 HAD family hydrolase [Lactiplantibacillus pentosus]MCT3304247.1 HAD family hydrolase [Lactiplantibacillus pentosus]PRO79845.1 phosphohydrolase [Lactiplantibacillus pentosus]PRO80439.1 phosphohydrolase [Lactiplantibacillus pentosus]